jgi:predicted phage terminase large subunit-like protein
MTTKAAIQKEVLELLHERKKQLSRTRFSNFVRFTFEGYSMQWFHKTICDYLDKLLNGDIKKLMIFVPPQHGKSELSSRRFPAYALGKNPDEKIAVCSYGADLASTFNRSIQMIIDDPNYNKLFPDTQLNSKRVSTETKNGVLRNSTMFEIVDHKGYLRTVGVGGGLTGITVDLGIIDDPFKDRMDANSITIRNRVWAWYKDVFETRLHNESRQLMLFTRWHEDDIAGRILDPNNPFYDKKEASEWTVIAIPAIKEAIKPLQCAIDLKEDKRVLGQALWENKHSRAKYEKMKRINPTGYASLAQQRPAPLEGSMILKEWFNILKPNELPFNMDNVVWDLWIDGAWTKKETDKKKKQNDPDETAVSYVYFDNKNKNLYIRCINGVKKEIKELIRYLDGHALLNGASSRSKVFIEMKASGFAIKPLLHDKGYNTMRIDNKLVRLGKYNRVEQIEPFLASGRIFLIQDNRNSNWIPQFLEQCISFPNAAHDDLVDVLCYPILHYFVKNKRAAKTNYKN